MRKKILFEANQYMKKAGISVMGIWLMTAANLVVKSAGRPLRRGRLSASHMFYTAGLGMSVTEGLALSFAALLYPAHWAPGVTKGRKP